VSRFSERRPGEFRLRFGWHLALWLALAVAVAVGTGLGLWWALGSPDLRGEFEARDRFELVKIALAVAAGVGGVVALVVASRKLHLSEAEHGREDTKLFNERFGNAADQLSSDKSAARLAGVYAMAGLADDWEAGRQTCIDVLCAYLRMPYTPPASPKDDGAAHEERLVRHSIIRIITTHLLPDAKVSWQGQDFDFTGALFDGGSFDGAVFSGGEVSFRETKFVGGEVRFIGAVFSGGRINFHRAEFISGEAAFVGAQFTGAVVDFSFAKFSGCLVNFISAEFLAGSVLFVRAAFTAGEIAFVGAEFAGAEVSFAGVDFRGATVSFGRELLSDAVDFGVGAIFSDGKINFEGAAFSAGKVSFVGARFLGSQVLLAPLRDYDAPPMLDDWPDGPPEGLVLPP
jgi:uncharacterized protein YjbI with pentapeptide repeats